MYFYNWPTNLWLREKRVHKMYSTPLCRIKEWGSKKKKICLKYQLRVSHTLLAADLRGVVLRVNWPYALIADTLAYLSVKILMDYLLQEPRYSHVKFVWRIASILKKKKILLTLFIYLMMFINVIGHFEGSFWRVILGVIVQGCFWWSFWGVILEHFCTVLVNFGSFWYFFP